MKDKVQARINWLQLLFALGIGVVFAMIGWLATADVVKPIIGILATIVIVVFSMGLAYISSIVLDDIDQLEGL